MPGAASGGRESGLVPQITGAPLPNNGTTDSSAKPRPQSRLCLSAVRAADAMTLKVAPVPSSVAPCCSRAAATAPTRSDLCLGSPNFACDDNNVNQRLETGH